MLNASQMHVIQSIGNDQNDSGDDDIPLIRLQNVWNHTDSNNLDLVTQLESDIPTQETY